MSDNLDLSVSDVDELSSLFPLKASCSLCVLATLQACPQSASLSAGAEVITQLQVLVGVAKSFAGANRLREFYNSIIKYQSAEVFG